MKKTNKSLLGDRRSRLSDGIDRHHKESETDVVSFWLLLLFIVVFFGIAAEEARRPIFGDRAQVTPARLVEFESKKDAR